MSHKGQVTTCFPLPTPRYGGGQLVNYHIWTLEHSSYSVSGVCVSAGPHLWGIAENRFLWILQPARIHIILNI